MMFDYDNILIRFEIFFRKSLDDRNWKFSCCFLLVYSRSYWQILSVGLNMVLYCFFLIFCLRLLFTKNTRSYWHEFKLTRIEYCRMWICSVKIISYECWEVMMMYKSHFSNDVIPTSYNNWLCHLTYKTWLLNTKLRNTRFAKAGRGKLFSDRFTAFSKRQRGRITSCYKA